MNNQVPGNSIGFRNNLLKARDFSAGKEAGYIQLSSTQGVKDVLYSVPTALAKIDTVLMINIDHFDYVNQRFGFYVGDVVLHEITNRLNCKFGADGHVARLGGDVYIAMVTGQSRRGSRRLAKQILSLVNSPIAIADQDAVIRVTASIGIATVDLPTLMDGEHLKRASIAARYAKTMGGGRAIEYCSSIGVDAQTNQLLDDGLHKALERNELSLVYQPIVDPQGNVQRVEALCRWTSPVLGSVPPAKFIAKAEANGTINSIGAWAIETACTQATRWIISRGQSLVVAVNVSGVQLKDREFAGRVINILANCQLPAHCLELELTESQLINIDAVVANNLLTLKSAGVRLALDDFGTGFSSLNMLATLPVNTLKVDRSFVEGMEGNAAQRIITRSIIDMALALELDLVVEGIESLAQANQIRAWGCTLLQGYWFGRPVPAQDLFTS